MGRNLMNRKRWRWIAIYIAIWIALGLVAAVELYISQLTLDKPVAWSLAFRRAYKEMFASACCVLGVLWVCGRLPLEPGRRGRWIGLHMAFALLFSVAHVAFVSWLEAGEISVQTGNVLTFSYLFKKLSLHYTISNLFKYWFVVLGYLGWQYYKRYRERERQASALATELVQARLQALRMQINPHFLFNTLNTISALIHEKPEAADRMVARMSELLRRTLDHSETQEVPLREEIDFLKSYLEIEQMRFPDRLTVNFNIEARTNELLVPHLILQPLVENALRHGIMPREEPGRVTISATLTGGDTLELKVWNNGNGLSDRSDASDALPREGIGLKNVRSRLAQLYGGAQQFTLENVAGGGVEARIRIPCCTIPRSQAPQVVVMSATEASQAGLSLPTAASAKPKCC